jgi:hypothetical protein
MSSLRITSPRCSADIHSLSAMIGPVLFHAGPREIEPFFVAPWSDGDGPDHDALPALMRRMRGEWPCVPFGNAHPEFAPRDDLPKDWRVDASWRKSDGDDCFHGFGAHHTWGLRLDSAHSATAEISYPLGHPIERVERRIMLREGEPALDFQLGILPRRSCRLPIALHPVFKLPAPRDGQPQTQLDFSHHARAWTFPAEVEPGRTLLVPNQQGVPVDAVHDIHGTARDLRALPFAQPSEELVLLTGTEGRVTLTNLAERYAVTVSWDADVLPSCLLWISNGGRLGYPWLGRVRALGIEPCAAPFDLGPAYAGEADTPLKRAGIPTDLAFNAQTKRHIQYSIAVHTLS